MEYYKSMDSYFNKRVIYKKLPLLITIYFIVIFYYGCKRLDNSLMYFKIEDVTRKDWRYIVNTNPISNEENVKVITLGNTEMISYHLVQLRNKEIPHTHNTHDLVVVVKQGEGVLNINNKSFDVSPGAIVFIPKGVPHYYENRCDCVSVAVTIFSPPFDGKDTHLIIR